MGSLIFNFENDVREMSFETLPEGEYLFSVEKVEPKSFSTGSKGYQLTLNVEDGEHSGRKVWDNLVLSANAAWKFQSFLKAVGINQNEVTQEDLDSWFDKKSEDSVIGLELYAQTKIKPAEGNYKEKAEIKKYLPYETDGEEEAEVGSNEVTL